MLLSLIVLIVPCYNEQEALPLFYRETTSVLREMDCDYELILVNDGSKDKTLSVMKGLAAADPCVFYYSFSRNFGKEAAMYAGFCNARGDYVAVMDADLQDPPSLLPEMVRILESGEYDSVATRRADRAGEPPVRSWFARRFYSLINKISDADIVDGARDFRLMTRDMKDAILSMSEYNRFSKGIFGWVGFKTYWLPYENVERVAGQTKWNFWKLFKYAIDGIINFSNAPLSIASWFGMLMTVVSFLFLIFIVVRCGLGLNDLCDHLHRRSSALLSRDHRTVSGQDLHGGQAQASLHHFRHERGTCAEDPLTSCSEQIKEPASVWEPALSFTASAFIKDCQDLDDYILRVPCLLNDRVRVFLIQDYSFIVKVSQRLPVFERYAPPFDVLKPLADRLIVRFQVHDMSDLFKVAHRLLPIDGAASRRDHTVICLDCRVHPVLHFEKAVDTDLLDDPGKPLLLRLLDQDIGIYEVITDHLCKNNADRALS